MFQNVLYLYPITFILISTILWLKSIIDYSSGAFLCIILYKKLWHIIHIVLTMGKTLVSIRKLLYLYPLTFARLCYFVVEFDNWGVFCEMKCVLVSLNCFCSVWLFGVAYQRMCHKDAWQLAKDSPELVDKIQTVSQNNISGPSYRLSTCLYIAIFISNVFDGQQYLISILVTIETSLHDVVVQSYVTIERNVINWVNCQKS